MIENQDKIVSNWVNFTIGKLIGSIPKEFRDSMDYLNLLSKISRILYSVEIYQIKEVLQGVIDVAKKIPGADLNTIKQLQNFQNNKGIK